MQPGSATFWLRGFNFLQAGVKKREVGVVSVLRGLLYLQALLSKHRSRTGVARTTPRGSHSKARECSTPMNKAREEKSMKTKVSQSSLGMGLRQANAGTICGSLK